MTLLATRWSGCRKGRQHGCTTQSEPRAPASGFSGVTPASKTPRACAWGSDRSRRKCHAPSAQAAGRGERAEPHRQAHSPDQHREGARGRSGLDRKLLGRGAGSGGRTAQPHPGSRPVGRAGTSAPRLDHRFGRDGFSLHGNFSFLSRCLGAGRQKPGRRRHRQMQSFRTCFRRALASRLHDHHGRARLRLPHRLRQKHQCRRRSGSGAA